MAIRHSQERTLEANKVLLHCEIRGEGPVILFVSGAAGDAAFWDSVADMLATDYTVVTYDRRGNSRSPTPANWNTTNEPAGGDPERSVHGVM